MRYYVVFIFVEICLQKSHNLLLHSHREEKFYAVGYES